MPAWRTAFRPRCLGVDCTFVKSYERAIRAIPDAGVASQAFLKFAKAATESFTTPREVTKSYPWQDGGALAAFVAYAQSLPQETFRFEMDKNTPLDVDKSAWGTKTPLL